MPHFALICVFRGNFKSDIHSCYTQFTLANHGILRQIGRNFVMIRIMFVCHGNICRSPMAEFVMKKIVADNKLADKFLINSSATSTEEIGNGIHRGTKAKLTEMNIPFTSHHAVQITKDDYKNYDYIIAMDSMNLRNLQRIVGFDNEKKIHRLLEFTNYSRDVADPWYTGNFDVTYTDIDNGCRALLEYIKEHNLKIN